MASKEIRWEFGPTSLAYINSTAQINVLIGPPGESKTFSSIAAILAHGKRCGQRIRIAIIRDTLTNIQISLVPSLYEYFQEAPEVVKFKNENKELFLNVGFGIEADLFGCNDPADLQRLQGGSAWSLIWINDPAPLTDKGNAGVPEEVYDHAAYRSTRKTGVPGRMQIDMNYADEQHWTFRRLIQEPEIDPDAPDIVKKVFFIPPGENTALKDETRQMALRVFKHDPAAAERYIKGQFAEFKPGKQVTPGYRKSIHLCPYPLIPAPGLECFAMLDGWHNPACILGQITRTNRLIYLDTVRAEGTDVRTLLETQVRPLLNSPKWKDPRTGPKWESWRIGGDPSMAIPDQSNRGHCTADDVQEFFKGYAPGLFKPRFERGPVSWSDREQAINFWLLQRDTKNRPMIYISNDNYLLHKGLNGAWHYKTDNSGNVISQKPEEDENSHYMAAWAYSVCILLGSRKKRVSAGNVAALSSKLLKVAQGNRVAVVGRRV